MRSIRSVVIGNFATAAAVLLGLLGFALFCLQIGEVAAVRAAIFMAAFVVFAIPVITFLECRRIWHGIEENPAADVTVPSLIIGLALFGCSYLV